MGQWSPSFTAIVINLSLVYFSGIKKLQPLLIVSKLNISDMNSAEMCLITITCAKKLCLLLIQWKALFSGKVGIYFISTANHFLWDRWWTKDDILKVSTDKRCRKIAISKPSPVVNSSVRIWYLFDKHRRLSNKLKIHCNKNDVDLAKVNFRSLDEQLLMQSLHFQYTNFEQVYSYFRMALIP